MPEYPKQQTVTTSGFELGAGLPEVHSISSSALENMGYVLFNRETRGQRIVAIYKNKKDIIEYDGVHWVYNGKQVQFVEDIKK